MIFTNTSRQKYSMWKPSTWSSKGGIGLPRCRSAGVMMGNSRLEQVRGNIRNLKDVPSFRFRPSPASIQVQSLIGEK